VQHENYDHDDGDEDGDEDDDFFEGISTTLSTREKLQGISNPTPHSSFPFRPSPLSKNDPDGMLLFLVLTIIQFLLGNWSGIKATFTFERMASYFFIHVYGPCALIVIISWVSFLLPRSSPPARVTLGVTSVLTVVTILNMLNNSMPKVI